MGASVRLEGFWFCADRRVSRGFQSFRTNLSAVLPRTQIRVFLQKPKHASFARAAERHIPAFLPANPALLRAKPWISVGRLPDRKHTHTSI